MSAFRFLFVAGFALALGLLGAPAVAEDAELILPSFTFTPAIIPLECKKPDNVSDAEQCQRIDHGTSNVLFQERSICRWIDNAAPKNDYLIPFDSQTELDSFFTNAPVGVTVDTCCISTHTIVGVLADGRRIAVTTPIGRHYASSAQGTLSVVQKTFAVPVTVNTCVTHRNGTSSCNTCTTTQKVDVTATCAGAGWEVTPTIGPADCTPPGPLDCPGGKNGTTYWVKTGPYSTSEQCPAPTTGTKSCTGDTMAEMICTDGLESATGNTRIDNKVCSDNCQNTACIPQGQMVPDGQKQCPTDDCFLQVSGGLLSDHPTWGWTDQILVPQAYQNLFGAKIGNFVGAGDYPLSSPFSGYSGPADFRNPSPYAGQEDVYPLVNADGYTFDGIALGAKTHVTIYASPNFAGGAVFDGHGPMIVENVIWQAFFPGILSENWPAAPQFPPSTRSWSSSNMQSWGRDSSIKVSCDP